MYVLYAYVVMNHAQYISREAREQNQQTTCNSRATQTNNMFREQHDAEQRTYLHLSRSMHPSSG